MNDPLILAETMQHFRDRADRKGSWKRGWNRLMNDLTDGPLPLANIGPSGIRGPYQTEIEECPQQPGPKPSPTTSSARS